MRRCYTHKFKPGLALVPVWGASNGRRVARGATLNMVGFKLTRVSKCSNCGHSIQRYK